MKRKCECPDDSMNNRNPPSMYSMEEQNGRCHKPNKCPCVNNLKQYMRGNKKLWLCSCCNQSQDKEIKRKLS